MATFSLRPPDGREDIALPHGKTTIGRGAFLGVSDKRVSRSHAVLEVSDGKLTVLPLHANPTFYKASKKDKFVALHKDEAKELSEGDTISLLPDLLCFEIICKASSGKNGLMSKEETDINKNKTRETSLSDQPAAGSGNNLHSTSSRVSASRSILDEFMLDGPSTSSIQPPEIPQGIGLHKKEPSCDFTSVHEHPKGTESTSSMSVRTPSKPTVQPAPLLQKTRKLPSWLQTTSETKSTVKSAGNKKGKGPATSAPKKEATKEGKNSTVVKTPVQRGRKTTPAYSDEEFIDSDNEGDKEWETKGREKASQGKRKTADMDKSDEEIQQSTRRAKKTRRVLSDSENDDDKSLPVQSAKSQTDVNAADRSSAGDHQSDGSDDERPVVRSKAIKATAHEKEDKDASKSKLPPCPYGKKCYRKNPAHIKDYSHSGSEDEANEAEENSDDDRPQCPYGSSCYRRNAQHKRDFKHTEPAGRPKRKAVKHKSNRKGGSDDDGDEPNTYDYNDSFIDDISDAADSSGSYEGSDDSDWQPQGDDGVEEDVNELVMEARGFLRNKR